MKKIIFYFVILFIFINCNDNKQGKKPPLSNLEYNEEDYYKVQGIIIKSEISFDYTSKYKRDYVYIYHLENKNPLRGIDKDSELMFDIEDPIAVMVNKKDSTDSFIGHRGIIDEETLIKYLSRSDNDYENQLSEGYLNKQK